LHPHCRPSPAHDPAASAGRGSGAHRPAAVYRLEFRRKRTPWPGDLPARAPRVTAAREAKDQGVDASMSTYLGRHSRRDRTPQTIKNTSPRARWTKRRCRRSARVPAGSNSCGSAGTQLIHRVSRTLQAWRSSATARQLLPARPALFAELIRWERCSSRLAVPCCA